MPGKTICDGGVFVLGQVNSQHQIGRIFHPYFIRGYNSEHCKLSSHYFSDKTQEHYKIHLKHPLVNFKLLSKVVSIFKNILTKLLKTLIQF